MKFDMGLAWRDAMAMLKANREVMLIVSGVFFFLPSLAAVLLLPDMQPPKGGSAQQTEQFLMEFYLRNGPIFVVMGLIQAVGLIALLALLRDDTKPTVGDALKTGLIGLLPYIGTQLLIALALAAIVGGAIAGPAAMGLGIVAGILAVVAVPIIVYVLIKLSLILPVIAIEKVMNPVALVKRSWALTKGNSLRILAFYILLGIVFMVISLIVGMVFGLALALLGQGTAYLIANGIISGALGAVATMIFASVLAAVHRQLAGPSTGNISRTFE